MQILENPVYREYMNTGERTKEPWMRAFVEIVPQEISDEKKAKLRDEFEKILRSDPEVDKKHMFWPPGTPVSEIRFWIAIKDEYFSLVGVVEEMLKTAAEKRGFFGTSRHKTNRASGINSIGGSIATSMDPTGAVTIDSYPEQGWNKISNVNELLQAVGVYSQNFDIVENPEWTCALLTKPDHPANPFSAFNPYIPFILVNTDNPPIPECLDRKNYISKGNIERASVMIYDPVSKQNKEMTTERAKIALKFPHPEFVIAVKPSDIKPASIVNKFTPFHQFDVAFRNYCKLAKSRPIVKLSLRAALPGQGRNGNLMSEDRLNNDQDDDQQDIVPFGQEDDSMGEISNDAGPVLLSRDQHDTDQVRKACQYWASELKDLGLSTAMASSYGDVSTHMLVDRELRDPKEMLGHIEEFAGDSKNPLIHMKIECKEEWDAIVKDAELKSKRYWEEKSFHVQQKTEYPNDEFPHLEDQEQVKRAILRRSYEDYQSKVCQKLAPHIREDNELQSTDALFGSYLTSIMGKPLAKQLNFTLPIFDEELSVFGHLMAWLMEEFEQVCLVANVHTILLKLFFGRLTCLRPKHDMVYNMLIYGDKMLSKSFILNLVQKWSIKNTALPFMDSSDRANNTDHHLNNLIMIIHEMSEEVNSTLQSSSAKEKVARLKDVMTSGFYRYICYQQQLDGVRSNRHIQTSAIQCHVSATNENITYMDTALKSRNDMVLATDAKSIYRENKKLGVLAMQQDQVPVAILREEERFTQFAQTIQALYWLVEQLIDKGALQEPTLFCTIAALGSVSATMAEQNQDEADARTRSRIIMIAREITIMMGLVYLFFVPNAIHFDTDFEISLLKDMDLYMADTQEIAVFVLGLFSDSIEHPERSYVQKALALLYQKNMKNPDMAIEMFKHINVHNSLHSAHSSHPNHVSVFDDPPEIADARDQAMPDVDSVPRDLTAEVQQAVSPAPTESVMPVPKEPNFTFTDEKLNTIKAKEYNLNFVTFKEKIASLAPILHNIMMDDPETFPNVMSTTQIGDVLNEFKRDSLLVPSYEVPSGYTIADVLSGKIALYENSGSKRYIKLVASIGADMHTEISYFLIKTGMEWLEKRCNSLLDAAITKSQHKFTREQKIVYGKAVAGFPFALKTLHLKREPTQTLKVLNPFYRNETARLITERAFRDKPAVPNAEESNLLENEYMIFLECSVEDECMKRRFVSLHIPITNVETIQQYNVANRDKEIITDAFSDGRKSIDYPETRIAELKKSIEDAKKASQQNARRPRESKKGEAEELSRVFGSVTKRVRRR